LAQELAGDALEAALRGAELTSRLLAFARRQPLRPEVCDANETIGAMVKLLGRTLGENVSIALALGADLWPVLVDRMQLETALTNLATNARDAMPRGGQLIISTRNVYLDADYAANHPEVAPNDYVMTEVRDTGAGIPPEILDRIFEPFFTTKETGKGTGLGLSMVFGFIKQSGGHINAWSEPGEGAAIRLYLPRAAPAAAPGAASQAQSPPLGDGRTILVVEDNAKLRQITARQLREAGYAVLEASDGGSALATLRSDVPIDLLFTDVVMPGEPDGYDLARLGRLRRPGLKVVLTSGYAENRVARANGSSEGYNLMHKPYRRTTLLRAVRESLDR
jgi:CheY-like chemotaxis protein